MIPGGLRSIACERHGWDSYVTTGRSVFNPHAVGMRSCAMAVAVEAVAAERADEVRGETCPVSVEREMDVLRV